jgi:hypothetical protein
LTSIPDESEETKERLDEERELSQAGGISKSSSSDDSSVTFDGGAGNSCVGGAVGGWSR